MVEQMLANPHYLTHYPTHYLTHYPTHYLTHYLTHWPIVSQVYTIQTVGVAAIPDRNRIRSFSNRSYFLLRNSPPPLLGEVLVPVPRSTQKKSYFQLLHFPASDLYAIRVMQELNSAEVTSTGASLNGSRVGVSVSGVNAEWAGKPVVPVPSATDPKQKYERKPGIIYERKPGIIYSADGATKYVGTRYVIDKGNASRDWAVIRTTRDDSKAVKYLIETVQCESREFNPGFRSAYLPLPRCSSVLTQY